MRVKIGTMPAGEYRQVKRAPKGSWYSLTRSPPKVGDTFAVWEEPGKIAVLHCNRIKPDCGPLYYGTRV